MTIAHRSGRIIGCNFVVTVGGWLAYHCLYGWTILQTGNTVGVESVSAPFAGKSVLIVDDDPDIVMAIKESFNDTGATLLVAEDGNAAVAMATRELPDLVILDAMLPRRSGFLVLEKIKAKKGRGEKPYVIMITGNQGKRHEALASSMGVDDYIHKPFRMDRLMQASERLLESN